MMSDRFVTSSTQWGPVRPIRTGLCKDNMAVLYTAPSWRHSARAAVQLSLKFSRE